MECKANRYHEYIVQFGDDGDSCQIWRDAGSGTITFHGTTDGSFCNFHGDDLLDRFLKGLGVAEYKLVEDVEDGEL